MPEFFGSAFWTWFTVVYPILDPTEFSTRFLSHSKDPVHHPLGPEGYILSLLLVVWAISLGYDQHGNPRLEDGVHTEDRMARRPGTSEGLNYSFCEPLADRDRRMRKDKVAEMMKEILELIDLHGVLRKPSWDGVRVLLLTVPLLNEPNSLEQLAIHEAALSQARALSLSDTPPGSASIGHVFDTASIRARTLWYSYIRESITTGIKGGRLILSDEDLQSFQRTVPNLPISVVDEVLPSPTSPVFDAPHSGVLSHVAAVYDLPLRLSAVCRKIHATLTGPKAIQALRQGAVVNPDFIDDIWRELDECWHGLNTIRRSGTPFESAASRDQFAGAWQICIFECHNVIRESLKLYCSAPINTNGYPPSPSSRPSSQSSAAPKTSIFQRFYALATQKCYRLLPSVLHIIRYFLRSNETGQPGFLQLDAGLVLDGCYFAGILAATYEGDALDDANNERGGPAAEGRRVLTPEDGVALSLRALAEMKWALSPVEIRQDAVKEAWKNRAESRYKPRSISALHEEYPFQQPQEYSLPYMSRQSQSVFQFEMLPSSHGHGYSLEHSPERPNTGHSASYSDGAWPAYTPPPTGTSAATSGASLSPHGSPGSYSHVASHAAYPREAGEPGDPYASDLEQFNFTTHVAPLVNHPQISVTASFHTTATQSQPQNYSAPSSTTYLDHDGYASTTPPLIAEGLQPTAYATSCEAFYHA
ncbi:hypothetical protein AX16_003614 [Volvariella volvacea WC 439]|nr:hypothetical protein AX16_003614 [Volvariella volvacea WC 439]